MKKEKLKIGDILEIPTVKGLAYAQYTHEHSEMGGLIRVFESLLDRRPDDFTSVINDSIRFSVFFPVRAAVNAGIIKVVGHRDVSDVNKVFPVFRSGLPDPVTKKIAIWWLWDGQKDWKVGDIDEDLRQLPIKAIWNHRMLVHRIEQGWRPEDYD